MNLPVILAHGSLGSYDELILLGAAAIFLVIMGISWVRSRNTRPEFEQTHAEAGSPEYAEKTDAPDHFHLD
jgi:hypothetical protein